MNQDCLKLTSYFAEHDKAGRRFLADALLDCYGRHRIATSVLLRGTEGFGSRQHLQTQRLLTLSEDLPMVAVAVDTRERVERALEEVAGLATHGLVTLERARLLTGEIGEVRLPQGLAEATKLTVTSGAVNAAAVGLPSWTWSTCCADTGSTARPCCWGWTAPSTASGSGPGSSGATRRCR